MERSRYSNSKIKSKKLKRGKKTRATYDVRHLSPVIYSTIPKSDDDIYVITQDGDRLDHLANQFYGNVNLWWYIARANGLKFMTLEPGLSLRIPAKTQYASGI
tara:strand:- start:728 stop:1036 length:309 start_codon:yes stop_codon:yes gene_type:complete